MLLNSPVKEKGQPMMLPVYPPGRPIPEGHYAPAVIFDGCVHVSGTLPALPPGSGRHATFDEQMESLLQNCDEVLDAAGSGRDKVVSLTLYVADIDNWDPANRALARFFGAHRPARSIICVPAIRKGYAVQASLIAVV
uniref:RidA family protein n=1 Tax=Burkholderia anthina TaxID=179879 RepID=UPI001ABAFC6F|nr:RidA family protein [Burkholderia anthina]